MILFNFFCPGNWALNKHRCVDNPDREAYRPFYTTIFFARAKKLCGASLHRPLVLNTIGEL